MNALHPSQAPRPVPLATFNHLVEVTAREFHITAAEIRSTRRHNKATLPRQVVMALACESLLMSLPQVGHQLERDHTTVLHAVRKVRERREIDQHFDSQVRAIARAIGEEQGIAAIRDAAIASLYGRLDRAVSRAKAAFVANPADALARLEAAFPLAASAELQGGEHVGAGLHS